MLNRKAILLKSCTLVAGIVAVTSGCVSDYRGWLGHMTESEAKLWGNEASIIVTPDPDGFTGTYAPTVKYDFRGLTTVPPIGGGPGQCPLISDDPNAPPPPICTYPDVIEITIYKNATVGAFSRDGCVDRDGDDLQQRPGVQPPFTCENAQPSATKFQPKYQFEDRNLGCQFFLNYDKTYGPPPKTPPGLVVCFNDPSEEVDKDLSLQGSVSSNTKEAFTSLDDLFNKIWSGVLGRTFTAEIIGLTINGNSVTLNSPTSIALTRNNLRPINWTIDLSTPGGKEIIAALLANTAHARPATLALHFDGGMTFRVPSAMTLGFNHDALKRIL
jgi:hypothetical protein